MDYLVEPSFYKVGKPEGEVIVLADPQRLEVGTVFLQPCHLHPPIPHRVVCSVLFVRALWDESTVVTQFLINAFRKLPVLDDRAPGEVTSDGAWRVVGCWISNNRVLLTRQTHLIGIFIFLFLFVLCSVLCCGISCTPSEPSLLCGREFLRPLFRILWASGKIYKPRYTVKAPSSAKPYLNAPAHELGC